MILSNINKHKYIYKLFRFIKYLNKVQSAKQNNKELLRLLKKKIIRTNTQFKNGLQLFQNENVIRYVINIRFSPSNTIVNLTDIKGNTLITVSEKSVNFSKDSKRFQVMSAIKIFQNLLTKASFIKNKAVSINFKNTKRYQESFCIKMLQSKVFIKSIQSYNYIPHNGCRPKKLKRVKLRTKRLVLR